ncbi:hypothetical protein M405DRAFT_814181 [Rhizopogon salebrosus TDB-379]|nr:hypothetical protein M405DRAFT_814181 [Rhizopogon salebrosus TDB-379]
MQLRPRPRPRVVLLKRLTIILDKDSNKGFGLTNANASLVEPYDLISLLPTISAESLLACLTHETKLVRWCARNHAGTGIIASGGVASEWDYAIGERRISQTFTLLNLAENLAYDAPAVVPQSLILRAVSYFS